MVAFGIEKGVAGCGAESVFGLFRGNFVICGVTGRNP